MHPNEPQDLEFSLDDIIREFSEPELDDILQEFGETPEEPPKPPVSEETVRIAPVKHPVSRPVTQETVRLDPIKPATKPVTQETVRLDPVKPAAKPVSQETVRLDPVKPAAKPTSQQTTAFRPVSQNTAVFTSPVTAQPEPEPAYHTTAVPPRKEPEPFSDEWEPEYDEPIGEYPQAEALPQQNRQAMLRKKLVAGPEKRYHMLAAKGLGKLQMGILFHLLLTILSVGITVAYTMQWLGGNQQRLLIFAQLVIGLVAGLVGCNRLLVGLGSLLRGRFTLNTVLAVAFVACMADAFFCLSAQRMPFVTVLCLDIMMAQWAEYQRCNTQIGQMDTLRKALEVTALVKVGDYFEGLSGYVAVDGDPDSFMNAYQKPSAPERRLELFGLIALLSAIGVSVYVGSSLGWEKAVQTLSAGLLAAVPATSLIIISRPIAVLESRLHRLGAVLCGWKGIREADRLSVYPLEHDDLFPGDVTKMNGVKFYGTVDPGRVVTYATALIAHDGKGMIDIFSQLPRSRNIQQHKVTQFLAYPGGITGMVDDWSVMVGTQEFLEGMGIAVPTEARIPQAVYAAVEGQFSAVFALQYNRSKSSAAGLKTLLGYRRIQTILVATDFILTDQFISSKLSVNVRRMVFPDREMRQHLSSTPVPQDAPVLALVTKPGLGPKAYALTGARALRHTLNIGSAVHMLAGAVGLVAVAVLALLGAFDVLTVQNLLAYGLVWMVPGLMITEWTRHV